MAFSLLMGSMDFYIHLLDTRAGLNTMEQNKFVHEKICIDDYAGLKSIIPTGENIFVVVMTVGYRTDAISLKAVLGKDLAYLGILGSSTKIAKMLTDLQEEGVSKDSIDRVYAPIGIPIKSQTPEEIAVSIAAEIISVKNKNL